MVVVEVKGTGYYMNPHMKKAWDKIKDGKLAKEDSDRVYIVDGREGTGKSLWTLQQAAYIDPTIIEDEGSKVLPRITFSVEETLHAIRNSKSDKTKTQVIIFDEAFRGLSSKSALSKTNKALVQAMMEMRQNNLVLFIVSPSFFLLEMYPAVLRSNTLFHITKSKNSNRRTFKAFNYKKKAKIYQIGIRKGWGYPSKTKVRDAFFNKYPGGNDFEASYRDKKFKSLRTTTKAEEVIPKFQDQRDKLIALMKFQGLTFKKVRRITFEIWS